MMNIVFIPQVFLDKTCKLKGLSNAIKQVLIGEK